MPPKVGNIKSNNACLVVNDSGSVTLAAPNSITDPKRTKSEVYDGFAHVFPPDSQQTEVYERVMDPLVKDFMEGKCALLAAMGPSGSGKTHTMFGCPREPGMVPLALQKIFSNATDSGAPSSSRSYYLSMFEIYSERGKGERIFDLLPDGADLHLQQSVLKGLQEVVITNVTEAESLIACGMLKRSTAATNSNSQSSRSQCIINIRSSLKSISDGNDFPGNSAVLTIADLAGAEREKKTGNQGARLLESNFINNTSMVFGLCLRSLLEHQRNPKKPFQKHFKSSLLTRYLKDYMEGKKHMTLMLTVKPGEDDYLDTSFLLRQASPYMKIKFNNPEENPSVSCQKRSTSVFNRSELPKRRKYNSSESLMVDCGKSRMSSADGNQIAEKGVNSGKQQEAETLETTNVSLNSDQSVQMSTRLNEVLYDDLQRMTRNEEILQKFAKALWNVLKQYKHKLEVSEKEVKNLKDTVEEKTAQIMNLEEEVKKLNTCCLCHKQSMEESSISHIDACAFGAPIHSAKPTELRGIALTVDDNLTPPSRDPKCNGSRGNDYCNKSLEELDSPGVEEGKSTESSTDGAHLDPSFSSLQACVVARDAENSSNGQGTLLDEESTDQKCNGFRHQDYCKESFEKLDIPGVQEILSIEISTDNANLDRSDDALQSRYVTDAGNSSNGHVTLFEEKLPESSQEVIHGERHLEELQMRLLKDKSLADDKGTLTQQNNEAAHLKAVIKKPELYASFTGDSKLSYKSQVTEPLEKETDAPPKPSNPEIHRRRLRPASSMLLKGFSLDIEKDNPMEIKSKKTAEGRERSRGSLSLVHLIKDNLHY